MAKTTNLTIKAAREVVSRIKADAQKIEDNLKYFYECNGHTVLGYESFLEFFDAELYDLSISPSLRNWIITALMDDAPRTATGRRAQGAVLAIADAVGLSAASVHAVHMRSRKRARVRATGLTDDDSTMLGFMVPNRWRVNILKYATAKDISMSDLIRPVVKDGMKQRYGVDVDVPTERKRAGRRK